MMKPVIALVGRPNVGKSTLFNRITKSRDAIVADFQGQVHFLSQADGSFLLRLPTDGSAAVGTPVLSGQTMIVVTRDGGLFAFRPA